MGARDEDPGWKHLKPDDAAYKVVVYSHSLNAVITRPPSLITQRVSML